MRVLLAGVVVSLSVVYSPGGLAQSAIDCAQGVAQCQSECAGERSFGFFRGKRYQECAARCEQRVARACGGESGNGAASAQKRGDKEHPEGKEYGYEKNADRMKGQQGERMSTEKGKSKGKDKVTNGTSDDLE